MEAGSSRFVASEAARRAPRAPAAGGAVPLVGGARLPLAFIVAGLVAFGVAAPWLTRVAWSGFPPFLHPEVVAIAHLWLPGFLLSVCLGATYQLMPVVLGAPLRIADGWLWAHAGLHVAGVASLVWGLAGGRYAAAGGGGLAVVLGIGVLAAATWRTFRASPRRDAAAWSFVFAAGWLLATTAAGVLMALNRRQPFLPLSVIDLLRAHAHLGLAGYFLSLLQGVTFQLVPMFTMGEARRPRTAMVGLLATQLGLPVLAAGLAWGAQVVVVLGGSVVALGMVCTGRAFAGTLATRRRRKLDAGVKAFVLGLFLLGASAAGGLFLVSGVAGPDFVLPGGGAYGLAVVGGGLSLAVLGMLAKILPFLVWMKAYGPRVGKEAVPVATGLSSRRLEEWWLIAHLAGLTGMIFGAACDARWPVAAGGVLLVMGAVVWLGNAARVLLHLRGRSGGENVSIL